MQRLAATGRFTFRQECTIQCKLGKKKATKHSRLGIKTRKNKYQPALNRMKQNNLRVNGNLELVTNGIKERTNNE